MAFRRSNNPLKFAIIAADGEMISDYLMLPYTPEELPHLKVSLLKLFKAVSNEYFDLSRIEIWHYNEDRGIFLPLKTNDEYKSNKDGSLYVRILKSPHTFWRFGEAILHNYGFSLYWTVARFTAVGKCLEWGGNCL
jgi:hypothetical protein